MSEDTFDLNQLKVPIPMDRVEFRVQSISEGGWARLLAYKDARVDMDWLDKAAPGRWVRSHQLIDGQLFCRIGIYIDSTIGWVYREDVGVESNTEKEKGRSSDAFKRAGFNWGIGRELYDYPTILVQLKKNEFYVKQDGQKKRGYATNDLDLKAWTWHCERQTDDNGRTTITSLKAIDNHGQLRFTYPRAAGNNQAPAQQSQAPAQQSGGASNADKPWYNDFEKEKDTIIDRIGNGAKPEQVIAHLEKKYRINKKTRDAILAMKPKTDGEGQQFDPNQNFDEPPYQ